MSFVLLLNAERHSNNVAKKKTNMRESEAKKDDMRRRYDFCLLDSLLCCFVCETKGNWNND